MPALTAAISHAGCGSRTSFLSPYMDMPRVRCHGRNMSDVKCAPQGLECSARDAIEIDCDFNYLAYLEKMIDLCPLLEYGEDLLDSVHVTQSFL